jgi:hypothetical protein
MVAPQIIESVAGSDDVIDLSRRCAAMVPPGQQAAHGTAESKETKNVLEKK